MTNGVATMRVRLIPLDVGRPSFGPWDCVRFACTVGKFQAETADGSMTQMLPTVGFYCLQCDPIGSVDDQT